MISPTAAILVLFATVALVPAGIALAGEVDTSCIENTNDDGSRPSYHTPSSSDKYLRDCSNPLNRELWRVYEMSSGSCYVVPRPDYMALEYGLCPGLQSSVEGEQEVLTVMEQNGMCAMEMNGEILNKINSMTPEDALAVTHALHEHLQFEIRDGRVFPFAPDEDILAACDFVSLTDENGASAKDYCDTVRERCPLENIENCPEYAITPTRDALVAIVPALNKLYGIRSVTISTTEEKEEKGEEDLFPVTDGSGEGGNEGKEGREQNVGMAGTASSSVRLSPASYLFTLPFLFFAMIRF